jgi:hypothetical protein
MPEALIIDAVRTPPGIGKVGKGALAEHHPQHLGATVLKALAERNNLNTAEVDDIIWDTSSQRGKPRAAWRQTSSSSGFRRAAPWSPSTFRLEQRGLHPRVLSSEHAFQPPARTRIQDHRGPSRPENGTPKHELRLLRGPEIPQVRGAKIPRR